jgi:uncharacterized membrane protein YbhN (UPF0104 family)
MTERQTHPGGLPGGALVPEGRSRSVRIPDGRTPPAEEASDRRPWSRGVRSWRAILLAPVGDGQTRRRGSDAVRLGAAGLAVLLCWIVTHANSKAEQEIATTLASPPQGVRWLISVIWWAASFGVIALVVVLALANRRWSAIRDIGLSGGTAWVLCVVSSAVLGSSGGRPSDPSLFGFDPTFPVARVAATVAVATAALPYLARMVQLTIETAVGLLAVAAVITGSGLPVAVVASLAVGWGVTALVHLIFGSPLGLPSSGEVVDLLTGLDLSAEAVAPAAHQEWGVGRFTGRIDGSEIDVSVYGRDASDAQLLAKTARFLFYRSSGPTLALTRRQQVEHEAYLTLMAERAGARGPVVLAAGPSGPSNDALLVTRAPTGSPLSAFAPAVQSSGAAGSESPEPTESASANPHPANPQTVNPQTVNPQTVDPQTVSLESANPEPTTGPTQAVAIGERVPALSESPAELSDDAVDDVFDQLMILRGAGIAHGSLSIDTIVVGEDHRAGFVDFRAAVTAATADDLNRDVAGALAAVGMVVGPDRAVASAVRSMPSDALVGALPFLQRAALDPAASRALRGKKALLAGVRERGAVAAGIDVPKLIEPRRISWVNLLLVAGTLMGGWALIGVLINVGKSWSTITGAKWGWVAATFVLAQAAYPAIATTTVGSVTSTLPYGRTVALEVADTFVALAAGSMGTLATRVRFFQQEGLSPTLAVSSGVLVSTASWIVKGALFLLALPFALGQLPFRTPADASVGGHGSVVWLIAIAVLALGVALGLLFAVPRWRRLAAEKLRPKASEVWSHLLVLAGRPRSLVEIFGGSALAQIFVALALGAALHAFGDHLGLATLLVVLTLASMLGGVSPVPGGMGVVEAGMILGLTAAGISEPDAVAATFVQRLFTAYLPPIWGWFVLVWLRRKEYL